MNDLTLETIINTLAKVASGKTIEKYSLDYFDIEDAAEEIGGKHFAERVMKTFEKEDKQ